MLKGHLEFGCRRCIVTPSRIRYGPIHVVLDSLPDQCAKDHTSTEMLVSHATYDLAPSSRFQGCANVEASDAITREENPDRQHKHRVEAATAGPGSYDPSHAFMGASPDSVTCRLARPVPLGIPLPGPRQRHSGTLEPSPIKKYPLDGLLCLFPSDHGDARVGRVPEGDIATARLARLLSQQHKTTGG